MWGLMGHSNDAATGRRISDQPSGHQTRSYLYDPVPTADLHMLGTLVMDQQHQASGVGGGGMMTQAANNSSEGAKLEHLQDVAGLKLMVMQMEKAREAMAQEKKKKKNSFSWTHVLYEFSQNTTMHGISKTTEDTPFLLRR